MKLHTVMVTFNRLECTKQSLASYLDTVTMPFTLVVVDNASTDGTQDWLNENFWNATADELILLSENKYPGYATNRGWEQAPADADFLQRADNDWTFQSGWCAAVEEAFADPEVGQVGLRTDREEVFPAAKQFRGTSVATTSSAANCGTTACATTSGRGPSCLQDIPKTHISLLP